MEHLFLGHGQRAGGMLPLVINVKSKEEPVAPFGGPQVAAEHAYEKGERTIGLLVQRHRGGTHPADVLET